MEKRKNLEVHFVVRNLIKIMTDNSLNKSEFADKIGLSESKWNKIANGRQKLNVEDLSKIAKKLRVREIDIYTYPMVFSELNKENDIVKAQLTIELREELKDKVLQLVFGNKNIEILNK